MADKLESQNYSSGIQSRAHWASRAGFILAAVGSAVGLGNIWKFPYITGVYGGGAFVLVYLGCVLIVGLPLMISEFIIGRRAQQNPVAAFQRLHRERSPWQGVGWLGVISGFVILSFYSVVASWALAYIVKAIIGFAGTAEQLQTQFANLKADPVLSTFWHTVFIILTVGIVLGGIREGIERWAKILMPALLVILVGLMLYGLFGTDGGMRALAFLFEPNFSELSAEGFLSALGHAFFTLSLGMGAMITYGSYMGSKARIVRDAVTISILDTAVALLAGIAIFSLVFAYGMEPNSGTGLIFETLPVLFSEIGRWVSIPFFVLLAFAALTSSISLLEVVVSYFIDVRKWSRTKATLIMGSLIYLVGILSALSALKLTYGSWEIAFFPLLDVFSTNYMLPIGGLFTCLYVAWVVRDKVRSEEFGSSSIAYRMFMFTLRFITPVAVVVVILHGLGLLAFNAPPVIDRGALYVSNPTVTKPVAEQVTITATFYDDDQPGVEAFLITLKLRHPTDSTEFLLLDKQSHGSKNLTITENEDSSYTASLVFSPSVEYAPGIYDLYFEVTDGTDRAIIDYASSHRRLEIIEAVTAGESDLDTF